MKHMFRMYAKEAEKPKYSGAEQQAEARVRYAFAREAQAAGVLLSINGLEPVTGAATMRARNGKTLTTDDPFAETHEQLGGYYWLDCKDFDEAICWAARIPIAKIGTIEVRPLNAWSQK